MCASIVHNNDIQSPRLVLPFLLQDLTSGASLPPVIQLTPVQKRLQEQLLQKHQQLQDAIMRQQEELRMISEQLNLTYTPTIPQSHQPQLGKDNKFLSL